jgi:thioredoxin 1
MLAPHFLCQAEDISGGFVEPRRFFPEITPNRYKEESVAIAKISSKAFKQEIQTNRGRIVADFYADWCGPCRQVAPVLDELSSRFGDGVRFVKIDIDESPDIARAYGIFSIPTIVLFEDGEPKNRVTGARPAHVIERELDLARTQGGEDQLHCCA